MLLRLKRILRRATVCDCADSFSLDADEVID
jgi:hypothetical protein